MPAWFALIVQPPAPTKLTVDPDTVHTDGVSEVNATARPELLDAATVYVAPPTVALVGAVEVNEID